MKTLLAAAVVALFSACWIESASDVSGDAGIADPCWDGSAWCCPGDPDPEIISACCCPVE